MSQAASIEVWATVALREAYLILGPRFEQATGQRVAMHWVPTVDLMNRLKAGEITDLVISTAKNLAELTHAGVIVANSHVPLAKSGVAMAVRAGAKKPDISSAAALKQALLAAKSVSYSTGPSGVHLIALIERLGLTEALRPKVKQVKGEPIGAVVARGDAELGFQQLSELLPVTGIDIVGMLPPEAQETAVFTAGVHVNARSPSAARELAEYIAAPAAAPILMQTGLTPL